MRGKKARQIRDEQQRLNNATAHMGESQEPNTASKPTKGDIRLEGLTVILSKRLITYIGAAVLIIGAWALYGGVLFQGTGGVLGSGEAVIPSVDAQSSVANASGGYQTIYMNVTYGGWQPDRFILKTGVPVKWVIDGQQLTGCNRGIKVPSLGLQFDIKKGLQTIEFTPTTAGTVPWSCYMGMIHGTFIVKDNPETISPQAQQAELNSLPKSSGSGGCGCGM